MPIEGLVTQSGACLLYSDRYRCIFIHQRKVAGTAIKLAFGVRKRTGLYNLRKNPEWSLYNDGVLSPEWVTRPDYFVFSAVRNPFDRLVSAWCYLESTRDRSLLDVLQDPPREGHGYRHLTRPQLDTIRNEDGSMATQFLLRYETLRNDFKMLSRIVGLGDAELPLVNRSERASGYRQYFNNETRRIAERMFREDLEAFGYDF
jgi:hypothetical protein